MNRYFNRELSWLSFNERVLQEAEDATVPLLERLNYLGIYSANIDEFNGVRIGSLNRAIASGEKTSEALAGEAPEEIIKKVDKKTKSMRKGFDGALVDIFTGLRRKGILLVDEKRLGDQESRFVADYFAEQVRPRLVPVMLKDPGSFPYLRNLQLYLAVVLEKSGDKNKKKHALIEIPVGVLPRFVEIPGQENRTPIILLDDVIRYGLKDIFSMFDCDEISAYTIKVTRDLELDLEKDVTTGFFEQVSRSLKARDQGVPVRFVYDEKIPPDFLELIARSANLSGDIMFASGRYHNARDMKAFPSLGNRYGKLRFQKPEPLEHPVLREHKSLFTAIEDRDVLLHYPYQSFQYVIDLLREAAIDDDVTSIKMTLYRVADDSQVVNMLLNAIRNGKKVTVFVDIQASFDEEANINWTEMLAAEGADVVIGIPQVKIHSKLILITRKSKRGRKRFSYIGTGNFNEATARIYTDHALLTCDPAITREVKDVFDFLEDYYKTFDCKNLLVAPFQMEKKFLRLIKNEMKNARAGKEAYVHVKLNGLSQKKMIDHLYEAGRSGVEIRMVIRGICCLVPGVKGLSENIEVLSIVDRYLEHSRIFIFCNDSDPLVFIGSADWMPRNLERRLEVVTPILDDDLKRELIDYLNIQLKDNVKARVINRAQDNSERNSAGKRKTRAQVEIHRYLKNKLGALDDNADSAR